MDNKAAHVSKSFYCLGRSLSNCFNCSYCRISKSEKSQNYDLLPSEINERFSHLPIAINLFYGDPLLQVNETIKLLKKLEYSNHKGPVIIITKGDYSKFPEIEFNLDLHIAFSTFGKNHIYDGGSTELFIKNLEEAKRRKNNYKYSIEFRPICYNINDDDATLEFVFKTAKEYNLPIGFSGLQGKPEIVKYWENNNITLLPYPNFKFGHLKPISDEIRKKIYNLTEKYDVKVFAKTSCLISYLHNLERDYNNHFYRPDEVNCEKCVMKEKCFSYKENPIKDIYVPFDHFVEYKEKHSCSLMELRLCNYPTENCSRMNGYAIKILEKITAGDYRLLKWINGYIIDANFTQNENISNNWFK